MEGMGEFPDNYFDLAIVDPPYGKGISNYGRPCMKTAKFIDNKDWDEKRPNKIYFIELKRVSCEQVVWGMNHFIDMLDPTNGFISWWKHMNGNFSECELAWCSFGKGKFIDRAYQLDQYNKIHPTQKPIHLYRWILLNYAKAGWKILDTHVGSGSSLIACEWGGFDYVGFELDKDYYKAAKKRLETWRQGRTIELFKSET